jgi:hypothetical protein
MSRILIVVVLLGALADAGLAAEVNVGPEVAVTPVVAGPAAFSQGSATVASNGKDFLAIWSDLRRGRFNVSDLYVSRIGRDGKPTEPFGHRIAGNAGSGLIASADGEYLVVYEDSNGISTQRLDENGVALAAPRVVTAGGPYIYPVSLTSNGSGYMFLVVESATSWTPSSSNQRVTAMFLDRDGALVRGVFIGSGTPAAGSCTGIHGGSFVEVDYTVRNPAVYNGMVTAMPILHTFSDTGTVTNTQLPEITVPVFNTLTVAFSPDAILITWLSEKNELTFLLNGYDGNTMHGPIPIDPLSVYNPPPAAVWTGNEFEIAYRHAPSSFALSRIAGDGTVINPVPFTLTTHAGPGVTLASSGGLPIAVWSDDGSGDNDITARTFASFDAVPDRANLISKSGSSQTSVQVARSGNHEIAVWSDRRLADYEDGFRVYASVDGAIATLAEMPYPQTVSQPRVAATNNNFVVVWADQHSVLARRIALDGHLLDTLPIVLSTDSPAPPSVASDGSTWLVTWSGTTVYSVRLRDDGVIESRSSFPVKPSGYHGANEAQATWTGDAFLLGYTLIPFSSCDASCHVPDGIGGAGIDRAGAPTQPKPSVLLSSVSDLTDYTRLGIAFGAGRLTFAWPGSDGIEVAQTTIDGTPVTSPHTLIPFVERPCSPAAPAIGWDGIEFVVAWIDCDGSARAARMNPFGDAIDLQPIEVSADALAYSPSVVPTPDGVEIVYSRNDADNGDAPRAFKRSLVRLTPQPPRRRATGH